MRVLAIDTSNVALSVAVVEDERVLAELSTNENKNHSVRLMNSIALLLEQVGMTPKQLDGIVAAKGPGSYTGVRIGVATAKSMAWALGIPVTGVSSLQVLAANAIGFSGGIVPLFDARRDQVYTGYYQANGMNFPEIAIAEQIVLLRDWLGVIREQAGDQPILFLGDDVKIHQAVIQEQLGAQARFAPASYHVPRAGHLGLIGIGQLVTGISAHELVPEYLQLAEAEAKWLAAQEK